MAQSLVRRQIAVALMCTTLAVAVTACHRDAAPANAETPAAPAPATAVPATDQPAQDVPPATAPMSSDAGATASGSLQSPPSMKLARYDGYGDMHFGMTPDEARKAWGGELAGKIDDPQGCAMLMPISAQATRALTFMFEGGKFVRYDERTAKEDAPGGGKVGMQASDIMRMYAGRIQATPHKYVPGGQYLSVPDLTGGQRKLVFETDKDGKVTQWRVGVAPQVDYVEGCG